MSGMNNGETEGKTEPKSGGEPNPLSLKPLANWLKIIAGFALVFLAVIIGVTLWAPPTQAAHAWTITILVLALSVCLGFTIWGLIRIYEHDRPDL
jgi:hypothetical protein